ncbi:MAG TPA: TetR/AcrR family transcriptional regulator [Rhodoblastus sp.]|nr:TetR/AcrR family transcriptional regulator [Rhodoblastus sp.]
MADNPAREDAPADEPLSGQAAEDAAKTTATGPVKPATETKTRQILDGARRVFLADGYDGASMNDIARAAGVSKGTLYVYFPSKSELFETLIRSDRAHQAEQLFQFGPDDEEIGAVLSRFGLILMRNMCRADHLAHMRMVIGAVAKYPWIGKVFFEAGPKAGAERLGAYLAALMARGRIARRDPVLAADQFIQLCQAGYFKAALFRVAEPNDDDAIRAEVAAAVEAFLLICGCAAAEAASE